jgi:hypothetical protein
MKNVALIPINSPTVNVFSNEPLQITGAKVRTDTQTFDLNQAGSNIFSLAGFQAGIYTLDIIVQKGSDHAVYETIIVCFAE